MYKHYKHSCPPKTMVTACSGRDPQVEHDKHIRDKDSVPLLSSLNEVHVNSTNSSDVPKTYIQRATTTEVTCDTNQSKVVANCWATIEKQCEDMSSTLNDGGEITTNQGRGWKTIRLFVSSTFSDFHSEREMLVKKVFPDLREWCEERKLHVVECDLRWGVPKDTTTAATICTCMEELDRCHQETDGQPFFLNFIGERYGWLPSLSDVPTDVQERYSWVANVSITHMEILHGAYRSKNPNALFFLRGPDVLGRIPETHLDSFRDSQPLSIEHLKVLKQKIIDRFPDQVSHYSCCMDQLDSSTGREKVKLTGLDDVAQTTLTFLKNAITEKYPDAGNDIEVSRDEHENGLHLAVLEKKSEFCRGRDEELDILMKFVTGQADPALKLMESDIDPAKKEKELEKYLKIYDLKESSNPLLCVTGQPGYGKTTLLAKLGKEVQQKGFCLLYHHVGCTSDSMSPSKTLYRIVKNIARSDDVEKLSETSVDQMKPVIVELLKDEENTQRKFLIIIDGISQMSDRNSPQHLDWLPSRFPGNIRCVVSCDQYLPTVHRLACMQSYHVELSRLQTSACTDYVQHYFAKYNKVLDKPQMSSLLDHTAATVPLWLSVACEELRVYGDFRTLTTRISSFPDTLDGLFYQALDRLLKEDEFGCMVKLICLVYCSLGGIPESSLGLLLGDLEMKKEAPLVVWATIRRSLKPFLRSTIFWYNGVSRVGFDHDLFRKAVKERLMPGDHDERKWHTILADYYEHACADPAYTVEDLPYHLYNAKLNARLCSFYRKDRRSIKASMHSRRKYMRMLRCTAVVRPDFPMCKPLIVCVFCSSKFELISPDRRPGDSCYICASWVTERTSQQAMRCARHVPFTAPNTDMCAFCKNMIVPAVGQVKTVRICTACNPQTCCQILL